MFPNDPYFSKAIEYLLGIGFLLLFIPFWAYATGGARARQTVRVAARVRDAIGDMFSVPAGVMLHPGHAWARPNEPGLVTVGMDDFSRQLVGPLKAVDAPAIGSQVEQGRPAWTLRADGRTVDMLSPVSGFVVAVNDGELRAPRTIHDDPYGRWLLKVRTPKFDVDARQLLADRAARQYQTAQWEELSTMMTPELGTIVHDGGMPVNGFARGIDDEHWDAVARRFLRS